MGERITKTGVVKAIQGRIAVVVTEHEPECESCSVKDACSFLGGGGANMEVRARNTAGARVGDTVKISLQGSSFLKATFLIYMVPILALLGGALCGYVLARFFSVNENFFAGVLGVFGVLGSFFWLKKKGKELSERQEFTPEIVSKRAHV